MKDIFIIGSRGLPAQYGGFETFVEKLISHKVSPAIRYHVACLSDESSGKHFDYKGADCFTVNPPKLGPASVIAYDMMAINYSLKLIKKEGIQAPIFYILGNTIGAFIVHFAKKIQSIGGILLVNPDGLEWKRAKWSKPVQSYLKYSEKEMTKYANLIISDNRGIETYIHNVNQIQPVVSSGVRVRIKESDLPEDTPVRDWYQKWETQEKDYYLILGRFVPENNYETVIREFMKSSTERDLVIICNHEGNAYFDELRQITGFDKDKRVKFVGTVYDQDLLKYIRNQAFAYIHGHEVGGTNPGLLEALAQTDLNLIYNVDFNHQVAQETALYWNKEDGNLSQLIDSVDGQVSFEDLGNAAKANMKENYTWEKIVGEYEELFLS